MGDSLLNNEDFQNQLCELGFKKLGSGWFSNKKYDIRIRLWRDCEVDFYIWADSDYNERYFRGKIYSIEEVKWVLQRCFNFKQT